MGREQRTGVFDLPENPSLSDLFRVNARNIKVTIRTATIGVVAPSARQPLGYDPATQLCSVLVQQLTVTINPDVSQGAASTITQPPTLLVNIPVAWPASGRGFLTFPLTIGDSGELIIQDRSTTEWRKKGTPVDPTDNWTHNRADAVFHPGFHSDNNPLPPTDQFATVLDGENFVKIGAGASILTGFLVKQQQLEAAITLLLNAGVTAGTGAVGTTGTLAFTAAQTAWNAALIANPIGTTKAVGE